MTIVNHIHLDKTGLSYDADDAPSHRWGAVARVPEKTIQAVVHRSANGHTYVARVRDGSDVMIHHDWTFQLRVTLSELNYLTSLLGEECEFIDLDHVANGTSHTAYIQDVTFLEIQNIENLGPIMAKYNITIRLVDMENPS